MIRISSIGLSFISLVGNPCRAAALAALHQGRSSRLWGGGRANGIEGVLYIGPQALAYNGGQYHE
jgi:hypothetical protein